MLSKTVGKWQIYMPIKITSALCCLNMKIRRNKRSFETRESNIKIIINKTNLVFLTIPLLCVIYCHYLIIVNFLTVCVLSVKKIRPVAEKHTVSLRLEEMMLFWLVK